MTRNRCATIILCALAAPALAQIDPPPGPITPTFKTLDQVEPSIPIGPDTTPGDTDSIYKITEPGRYHLTESVRNTQDGVYVLEIATSSVTLDLRGFTLGSNTTGAISTIHAAGMHQVVIRNGKISAHGDGACIDLGNGRKALIENITAYYGLSGIIAGKFAIVRDCRVERSIEVGIRVGDGSIIETCTLYDSPYSNSNAIETGESAIVRNCTIDRYGNIGILPGEDTKISGCTIRDAGFAGVYIDLGATIKDTTITHCDGWGIYALNDAIIEECDISHNGFDGIRVYNRSRIVNNTLDDNGREQDQFYGGIFCAGNSNTIDDNTCRDNYHYGIYVGGTLNTIHRNHAVGNTNDFHILAPTQNHWPGEIRPGSSSHNSNANFRS